MLDCSWRRRLETPALRAKSSMARLYKGLSGERGFYLRPAGGIHPLQHVQRLQVL